MIRVVLDTTVPSPVVLWRQRAARHLNSLECLAEVISIRKQPRRVRRGLAKSIDVKFKPVTRLKRAKATSQTQPLPASDSVEQNRSSWTRAKASQFTNRNGMGGDRGRGGRRTGIAAALCPDGGRLATTQVGRITVGSPIRMEMVGPQSLSLFQSAWDSIENHAPTQQPAILDANLMTVRSVGTWEGGRQRQRKPMGPPLKLSASAIREPSEGI